MGCACLGDAEPQKQITRRLGSGGGYRPWEDSGEDGEGLVPAWEDPAEWGTREGVEIVESGCPVPKFEKACGIDVKIRCSSSEECGAGRLCCPSLHTELNNECSYCTQPIGNAKESVCTLHFCWIFQAAVYSIWSPEYK